MSLKDRIMHFLGLEPAGPDPVKEALTERQLNVADKLAKMKGTTRDEVLAEAYRKADKILADRHD